MGCTIHGHKTFLVVCNIGLLFTGLCILVLGMKMKSVLIAILLLKIPVLLQAVKAVIAAGFLITLTGGTGFCGACYEVLWLVCVHLGGLGVIILMEFAIGVTLMIVKSTVETFMASADCGVICNLTLQSLILDLAMPSAGLLMTIIIMQALMIYSAVQLYFYLRERPKDSPPTAPPVVVQNMQMQNVAGNQPPPPQIMYPPTQLMYVPRQPTYGPLHQPSPGYDSSFQPQPKYHQSPKPPTQPGPYCSHPESQPTHDASKSFQHPQTISAIDMHPPPPSYADLGMEHDGAKVQLPVLPPV